ncbi:hypothetical protein [Caballeronia sp. INML2]|uniref:hypothetical protein n=1 Tax=Caballeronia sp. INML2 TaxID=2921748 RepID=UPI002028A5DD|nr:hypothetical protein [Caballeronia sp. INML2]
MDDLARASDARHVTDVGNSAINAAENLLADANDYVWSASLAASGRPLPILVRSQQAPV